MTDADTLTPTDAIILSLAYDCSALPETCTDATLLVFAHAVLAKWGSPAPANHPVAVPEPHYGKGRYLGFARYNDAYSVAQVQAMLAAAPRNAPLYDPDDVAFPTQRCADGTDAPTELTSIAAAEVAAPSGPAREPLTDEQVEELLSEANRGFCIETEDYFKAFRDAEIAHGITAAKKGGQHGAE